MDQSNLYKEVGKNIRFYRKLRHMTQKELGEKLYKSMACISKYESGQQPIDLHTIYKIADHLCISPTMLLPNQGIEDASTASRLVELPTFFQKSPLYLYLLRTDKNDVTTCVIDVQPDGQQVIIYFAVRDIDDYKACTHILFGTIAVCETNIRIYCSNPLLKGDFTLLCIRMADLILNMEAPIAFITALSTSYRFISSKCVVSRTPIPNPKCLLEKLALDKSEISNIKRHNYFSF